MRDKKTLGLAVAGGALLSALTGAGHAAQAPAVRPNPNIVTTPQDSALPTVRLNPPPPVRVAPPAAVSSATPAPAPVAIAPAQPAPTRWYREDRSYREDVRESRGGDPRIAPPGWRDDRRAESRPDDARRDGRRWADADQRPRRPWRGYVVPGGFMGPRYYIQNWGGYGLSDPGRDRRWQRYYDDAVLVDAGGVVHDSVGGIDWDRYDRGPVPEYVAEGNGRDREEDRRYDEYFDRRYGAGYDYPAGRSGEDVRFHRSGSYPPAAAPTVRTYTVRPGENLTVDAGTGTTVITIQPGVTTTTTTSTIER